MKEFIHESWPDLSEVSESVEKLGIRSVSMESSEREGAKELVYKSWSDIFDRSETVSLRAVKITPTRTKPDCTKQTHRDRLSQADLAAVSAFWRSIGARPLAYPAINRTAAAARAAQEAEEPAAALCRRRPTAGAAGDGPAGAEDASAAAAALWREQRQRDSDLEGLTMGP